MQIHPLPTHWKRPWCWERLRAGGEGGATEDEMVGWHHWLNGHEFEQTPGDSEGQGSLACCSPWGHKESAMTEQLNDNQRVSWKDKISTLSTCLFNILFEEMRHVHGTPSVPKQKCLQAKHLCTGSNCAMSWQLLFHRTPFSRERTTDRHAGYLDWAFGREFLGNVQSQPVTSRNITDSVCNQW